VAHRQRDLKRERTWRRHIERQRSSGQTIRMYCEFHRLRETSFYFWRQEIAKRDRESATRATAATPAPAFVPVAVIDPPTASNTDAAIDIRLAEGHRVRVRSGCDRGLLADVLALLRRSASEDRPC
jgi:transposase